MTPHDDLPTAALRAVAGVVAPALCSGCGHWAGRVEPLCQGCRRELRSLPEFPVRASGVPLWAPVAYEGPARALVSALKFRGAAQLAETMAAQMAAGAPPAMLAPPPPSSTPPVLVPVPLHPQRRRGRGYNQAELLAAAVAKRTGLGMSGCLEREGPALTQVGRGLAERAEAIHGTIGVRAEGLVPRHPVVVDDVVTTGATLAACAEALFDAGAHTIAAIAYARTPGR